MPASAAGVVPKSFGSTLTPYLKNPKRTSSTVRGVEVKSAPTATLWLRTSETPPRRRPGSPAAGPEGRGPLMSYRAML